jgi:hypothetical protein
VSLLLRVFPLCSSLDEDNDEHIDVLTQKREEQKWK